MFPGQCYSLLRSRCGNVLWELLAINCNCLLTVLEAGLYKYVSVLFTVTPSSYYLIKVPNLTPSTEVYYCCSLHGQVTVDKASIGWELEALELAAFLVATETSSEDEDGGIQPSDPDSDTESCSSSESEESSGEDDCISEEENPGSKLVVVTVNVVESPRAYNYWEFL